MTAAAIAEIMTARLFTSSEIEAGRRLFAKPWDFFWAASSVESLPKMRGIEIAFAGRSNVGKSSLINALTGRKSLVRVSHTPGRTQELVFFAADPALTVVDMPGYGYAQAPRAKIRAWTDLIHSYLHRPRQPRPGLRADRRPPRPQGHRRAVARRAERGRGEPPDRADQGRPGEAGRPRGAHCRDRARTGGTGRGVSAGPGDVLAIRQRHSRTAGRGGQAEIRAGRPERIGAGARARLHGRLGRSMVGFHERRSDHGHGRQGGLAVGAVHRQPARGAAGGAADRRSGRANRAAEGHPPRARSRSAAAADLQARSADRRRLPLVRGLQPAMSRIR